MTTNNGLGNVLMQLIMRQGGAGTRDSVDAVRSALGAAANADPRAFLTGVRDSYVWPALAKAQDAVAFNPYGNTAAQEATAQVTGPPAPPYPDPGSRVLYGMGQDAPLMPLAGPLGAVTGMAGSAAGHTIKEAGGGDLASLFGDVGVDSGLTLLAAGPVGIPLVAGKQLAKKGAKAAAKKAPKALHPLVEEALRSTRFRQVDPAEFVAAREGARAKLESGKSKKTGKPNTGRGEFLSKTSAEEMKTSGAQTFVSEDGKVGYAVDAKGDVQGVFSIGAPNAGKFAVIDALRRGGKSLDAFEGHLTNDLYPQFGFDETRRDPWNEESAPDKWNREDYGTPDVVFMERKPNAEPKNMEGAPKSFDPVEMQSRYPYVPLPNVGVNEKGKNVGKLFMERGDSPEADAVMKMRKSIQKEIHAGNYEPFFPLDQRFDVDPANYPHPEMTTKTLAKTDETVDMWRKGIDTPAARTRLKEAYNKGLSEMSKNWYMLGQLEEQYVKRLGPEEGRRRFADHIDAIAATTGGNDPTSNWLMARWAIHKRAKGEKLPEVGALMPSPIGGRYAGNNSGTFEKLMHGLGIESVENPKRYDFSRNFLGHVDSGTIDEQMTKLISPEVKITKKPTKAEKAAGKRGQKKTYRNLLAPKTGTYGIYQDIIRETAKEMGVDPRMLQEVAWAGAKSSEGMPMMQHINESVERTSKITGLPPQEVINGWIDEKLPAFGVAGGLGIEVVGGQRRNNEKEKR